MNTIPYAFIKNQEVVNIAVFEENTTDDVFDFFKNEFSLDLIIPSANNATVGGTFDGSKFWFPQPYPSWTKDEELNEWVAPVPQPEFDPENPMLYRWNEELLNWEEISE